MLAEPNSLRPSLGSLFASKITIGRSIERPRRCAQSHSAALGPVRVLLAQQARATSLQSGVHVTRISAAVALSAKLEAAATEQKCQELFPEKIKMIPRKNGVGFL